MSSTNRGYQRHISDLYITPIHPILDFLYAFMQVDYISSCSRILDPCAGGNAKYDMSYPLALAKHGHVNPNNITTLDIRVDSRAMIRTDFLLYKPETKFDLIITNPAFNIALEIVKHALTLVEYDGLVIMLLRLNFFGSQQRKAFFKENMPKYCFIHSKRISFFPEDVKFVDAEGIERLYKKGSTDSCEYMHAVWEKSYKEDYCKTFVI